MLDPPVVLEEGCVWIGLRWMVDVSKVVEVLSSRLFHELNLLRRVHARVARHVSRRLSLHFIDGGSLAALRAVVNDSLFADGALQVRHVEHEAE